MPKSRQTISDQSQAKAITHRRSGALLLFGLLPLRPKISDDRPIDSCWAGCRCVTDHWFFGSDSTRYFSRGDLVILF